MNRLVSAVLASTTFLLVALTSTFAIAKSIVSPFSSFAPPTEYSQIKEVNTISNSQVGTFLDDILSYEPKLQFSYASWQPAINNTSESTRAKKVIIEELSKYSEQTLLRMGLKKVYLVQRLYVDGTFRSAMPETQFEDALYFDVSSNYFESENGTYMRRTVHHELSHLIDYNLFGTYRPQDNDWYRCNPTNHTYGKGGASMYSDVAYAHAAHPKPGFITGYATSGVDEDRAEVFAHYMTNRNYLYELAQNDASLSCKVARSEQLLSRL